MNIEHVAGAAEAWIWAWPHGNAHPRVVVAALGRLAARAAGDPQALAIVDHARRVVAGTPFGSISQTYAA